MNTEEKALRCQILLEDYRTVNEEILLYTKEMIRCFVYGAVLVAIYLGWAFGSQNQDNSFSNRISEYIPYGFILLSIYFLSLAYIKIGLSQYKKLLENKINTIVGCKLLEFNTTYVPNIQSKGFLKIGKAWYAHLPTPMIFLGFLIAFAALLVFSIGNITNNKIIILSFLLACGLAGLYVFFIYPKLLNMQNNFIQVKKRIQNEKTND